MQIILVPIVIVLILLLRRSPSVLRSVTGKESQAIFNGLKLRDCDPQGCGAFGASRRNRTHKGLDIAVKAGAKVKAPFDCELTRIGKPYANDPNYVLIEIKGTKTFKNALVKLMYVTPLTDFHIGKKYSQGDTIGTAQNIASKYGGGMVNHYHFEMYENGALINPEKYL